MSLAACLCSEGSFMPIPIFAFGSGVFFPLRQALEPYRSRGMQESLHDSARTTPFLYTFPFLLLFVCPS